MDATSWSICAEVLRQDPGDRGSGGFARPGALERAARGLSGAARVGILTGFPVLVDGRPRPETDGIPGAMALGRALVALGSEVRYVSDPLHAEALERCGAAPRDIYDWKPGEGEDPKHARAVASTCTHWVAIERPGRAADGTYRSMRGEDLTAVTGALDALLLHAPPEVFTVGIGDGGNEAGLGTLRTQIARSVAQGDRIATVVPATVPLVAGVSNWGAYALAAALGGLAGRSVLVDDAQAEADVRGVLEAGGVDGITREGALRVDGQPWSASLEVLRALRRVS